MNAPTVDQPPPSAEVVSLEAHKDEKRAESMPPEALANLEQALELAKSGRLVAVGITYVFRNDKGTLENRTGLLFQEGGHHMLAGLVHHAAFRMNVMVENLEHPQ